MMSLDARLLVSKIISMRSKFTLKELIIINREISQQMLQHIIDKRD